MIRYALGLLVCVAALYAHTIIYNANIYTLNHKQPWAEAVVFDQGKLLFVGSTHKALEFKQNSTKLVDAQNKFIMPGIIDAHTHTAIAVLLESLGVSLKSCRGKKEILQRLNAYKQAHPDQKIYAGVGFYPYAFGPKGPHKKYLDEIFPDSLAFFISNNGHQAWVNSKTLAYLGITKQTPDPLQGIYYYDRDEQGEPTGFLVEGAAFWPHLNTLGLASAKTFQSTLQNFLPRLSSYGITTLFDAGVPAMEKQAFKALQQLDHNEGLPLRYMASFTALTYEDAKSAVKRVKAWQKRYNTKRFQLTSVKFINDNSDDDHFGIVFRQKALSNYLKPILNADINVMIHTSQASSVHEALNAIEAALKSNTQSRSRVTLAHVNMVQDSDYRRFKDLGIVANIQTFDAVGGGYYEYRYMLYDELWADKLARYQHFFDQGVRVSASSDYPVCGSLQSCSPFYGIQIGMTRQKIGQGKHADILSSIHERLTLPEILQAYTLNAAYQIGKEKELGSIETGKMADMIILDHNPFEIDTYEIHKIKVLQTIVEGQTVYQRSKQ